MTNFIEAEIEVKKYLRIRYQNSTTVDLYALRLIELFKYYPATNPIEISELEINGFIKVLVNRKSSYSLVNQFIQSAEYYYNHINKKSYIFDKRNLPKRIEKSVQILDQKDVFLIIDNFSNTKHKAIFALIYSCCLEIRELLNIRQSDINTKRLPYFINIRDKNNTIYRQCYISNRVKKLIAKYWTDCSHKPISYLFEGAKEGEKYSETSVHSVIKKSFADVGLTSDFEIKVLRLSYIKHMVDLGVPLIKVLDNIGIRHFESIKRYTKLIHGDSKLDFTPLDKIIGNPKIYEPEIEELERIIFTLNTEDEQEYLLEALQCFRAGALKAGIVFTWSACIRFLQIKCIAKGYPSINEVLKKMQSNKNISNLSDFETIKESNFLTIAFELKIISKHEKSQLENNLNLRNHCGHPSEYKPEINKAKAFVEDIINLMKKKSNGSYK